jgi:hypothetical protein
MGGMRGPNSNIRNWNNRKPGTILAKPNRSQILNEMFHKVK